MWPAASGLMFVPSGPQANEPSLCSWGGCVGEWLSCHHVRLQDPF